MDRVYVVADAAKRNFLGYDSSSGYPYAAGSISSAHKFTDLEKAAQEGMSEAKSSYVRIDYPVVYEIALKEVNVSEILSKVEKIRGIFESLSEEDLRLLKGMIK